MNKVVETNGSEVFAVAFSFSATEDAGSLRCLLTVCRNSRAGQHTAKNKGLDALPARLMHEQPTRSWAGRDGNVRQVTEDICGAKRSTPSTQNGCVASCRWFLGAADLVCIAQMGRRAAIGKWEHFPRVSGRRGEMGDGAAGARSHGLAARQSYLTFRAVGPGVVLLRTSDAPLTMLLEIWAHVSASRRPWSKSCFFSQSRLDRAILSPPRSWAAQVIVAHLSCNEENQMQVPGPERLQPSGSAPATRTIVVWIIAV